MPKQDDKDRADVMSGSPRYYDADTGEYSKGAFYTKKQIQYGPVPKKFLTCPTCGNVTAAPMKPASNAGGAKAKQMKPSGGGAKGKNIGDALSS